MYKPILRMTGPAFVELFLASLYGMVNMVMVGRLDAAQPGNISAVGITNQPFFLLISFFAAVNIGTTTLVAWKVGAGQGRQASGVLRQSLLINLGLSVALGALGYWAAPFVMRFMATDAFVVENATAFFRVLCLGLPFMAINMAITAALRGAGQTKIPMYYNLLANIVNVPLAFGLIFGNFGLPAMGIVGAAVATNAARLISAVVPLCYIVLNRHSPIRVKLRGSWRLKRDDIAVLMRIGAPSSLEQIALQGGLMLFHRVVNMLGTETYDAHQIAITINGMAFAVSQAFSITATALVGQAVGVGDFDKARQTVKYTARAARVAAFAVALILIAFARPLVALFTDNQSVAALTIPIFFLIAAVQYIQSVQMCRAGALRGAGDTMYPFYSSLIGIWLLRLPLAYLFAWQLGPHGLGLVGAWLSFFFDQIVRNIVVKRRFNGNKWEMIRMKRSKD